eukprot:scaffold18705_cov35-Phaeocystis_antarctica.AAC.2
MGILCQLPQPPIRGSLFSKLRASRASRDRVKIRPRPLAAQGRRVGEKQLRLRLRCRRTAHNEGPPRWAALSLTSPKDRPPTRRATKVTDRTVRLHSINDDVQTAQVELLRKARRHTPFARPATVRGRVSGRIGPLGLGLRQCEQKA